MGVFAEKFLDGNETNEEEKSRSDGSLPYRIGGLLYMPALQENIAGKILAEKIPCLTAVAFCLEDAICDDAVTFAEEKLKDTFAELRRNISADKRTARGGKLPLFFVRVRSAEQISRLCDESAALRELATGFIAPKFDLSNAEAYLSAVRSVDSLLMPILESGSVADLTARAATLVELKNILDDNSRFVPNIRVGGNDFCALYGLRRRVTQTIYDINVVRDILTDILNVFAGRYVVSAPVWNYFGESADGLWAQGLRREIELDVANGFVGKTAIHP